MATALTERLGLRRGPNKTPEAQPRPEPLVSKAIELWKVLDPRREPDIQRSVYWDFYFYSGEKEVSPEVKIFSKIVSRYVSPGINSRDQVFTAALSINPEYRGYDRWDKWGEIPQKPESPISFQMTIWGPDYPQFPHDTIPTIMKIIEVPRINTLLILGEGTYLQFNNRLDHDLSDYNAEEEKSEWRRVFVYQAYDPNIRSVVLEAHLPQDNPDWKRDFVSEVLNHESALVAKDLSIPKNREGLAVQNAQYRERHSNGLFELGSIADGNLLIIPTALSGERVFQYKPS